MSVKIIISIPEELKEEAEKLEIDIRRVVEECLRRAIAEKKRKVLAEAIKQLVDAAGELPVDEWVEIIKSSRKSLDHRYLSNPKA